MSQPQILASPDNDATSFQMTTSGQRCDQGLFGPDSVTWKVWSHPAALVGLLRSFIVEIVSSADAAAALADRGTYQRDPIGRLSRTMSYFLTVVYGDSASVQKANERLHRIHSHIRGTTPQTGRPYSGQDPLLMLGTHLITWHSVYYAYEKLVGGLSAEEECRFFAESVRAAEGLGLDIESVLKSAEHHGYDVGSIADIREIPATRKDFARIMRLTTQRVMITDQVRDIVDTLISPTIKTDDPAMKRLMAIYPVISRVAIALTPKELCEVYGLSRSPLHDAAAIAAGRMMMSAARVPAIRRALEAKVGQQGYDLMRRAMA